MTQEELKKQKIDALKAKAMEPYAATLASPTGLGPTQASPTVVKPAAPTRTPRGGYDARKALMDKLLARYLGVAQ